MEVVSLHDKALSLLQFFFSAAVTVPAWCLFFKIRSLEKGLQENMKSQVAQSCVVPLCITLVFVFSFGTASLQEVPDSERIWSVLLILITMVLYFVLIWTYIQVSRKPVA